MRPESYREQVHEKRCGNCRYGVFVRWKEELLCFYGDSVVVSRCGDNQGDFVRLNGSGVEIMDGDEYSEVWGGRVLDDESGICDQWEAEPQRDKKEEE